MSCCSRDHSGSCETNTNQISGVTLCPAQMNTSPLFSKHRPFTYQRSTLLQSHTVALRASASSIGPQSSWSQGFAAIESREHQKLENNGEPQTTTGHVQRRSSVFIARLDSSALASKITPASPIPLTETALNQHRAALTTPCTSTHRDRAHDYHCYNRRDTYSGDSASLACDWIRASWPVPEHLHRQSRCLRPHTLIQRRVAFSQHSTSMYISNTQQQYRLQPSQQ
jgi:hypothetical protein